jgi:hypothetical protein
VTYNQPIALLHASVVYIPADVVVCVLHMLLCNNIPSVYAFVNIMQRHTGRQPVHDRPEDGVYAAIVWQKRWMQVDDAAGECANDSGGQYMRVQHRHADIRLESA